MIQRIQPAQVLDDQHLGAEQQARGAADPPPGVELTFSASIASSSTPQATSAAKLARQVGVAKVARVAPAALPAGAQHHALAGRDSQPVEQARADRLVVGVAARVEHKPWPDEALGRVVADTAAAGQVVPRRVRCACRCGCPGAGSTRQGGSPGHGSTRGCGLPESAACRWPACASGHRACHCTRNLVI